MQRMKLELVCQFVQFWTSRIYDVVPMHIGQDTFRLDCSSQIRVDRYPPNVAGKFGGRRRVSRS
jgi:hypothetical protein